MAFKMSSSENEPEISERINRWSLSIQILIGIGVLLGVAVSFVPNNDRETIKIVHRPMSFE